MQTIDIYTSKQKDIATLTYPKYSHKQAGSIPLRTILLYALLIVIGLAAGWYLFSYAPAQERLSSRERIAKLVYDHARAWATGDKELFLSTIHPKIIFSYPGRRLAYNELIEDFEYFIEHFENTKVYIHNILVQDSIVAVEWQFATTPKATGKRTSVSDAIIGEIKNGKIILWKEYLDGRISRLQQKDELPLEEGNAPFPSPLGSLRDYCERTKD